MGNTGSSDDEDTPAQDVLPHEILVEIDSYLRTPDFSNVKLVNKEFTQLAGPPHDLLFLMIHHYKWDKLRFLAYKYPDSFNAKLIMDIIRHDNFDIPLDLMARKKMILSQFEGTDLLLKALGKNVALVVHVLNMGAKVNLRHIHRAADEIMNQGYLRMLLDKEIDFSPITVPYATFNVDLIVKSIILQGRDEDLISLVEDERFLSRLDITFAIRYATYKKRVAMKFILLQANNTRL